MFNKKEVIYIKAISPIHAGSGQSLSSVDMPIQRERHSNIPKIEGSSLKGSIRHNIYHKNEFIKLKNENKEELKEELNKELKEKLEEYTEFLKIFGSENGNDYASAISITDAKLLFFPVRSTTGIYKLITCPYVLKTWQEQTKNNTEHFDINVKDGKCIVSKNSNDKEDVVLEEYVFKVSKNSDFDIEKKLEHECFIKDIVDKIVILSDSDFLDMVTMYTEIITRNCIDYKTGTAKGKGLFSEEYLPTETIMYFSVLQSAFYKGEYKPLDYFDKQLEDFFHVGGNETIGKGIVKRIRNVEGE